jgi:hypothetical protein
MWREKLPRVFFETAALNRQFEIEYRRNNDECRLALKALGKNAPVERQAEVVRHLEQTHVELLERVSRQADEIDRRWGDVPHNPAAFRYLARAAENDPAGSHDDDLVRYLHWMRHRESIAATQRSDVDGDLTAIDKLAATAKDWRRIVHGKGPLKPFQGDTVHRQLLGILLAYEMNEPLTAEERADCFDEYCPCGKTHDGDALKKQYARLKKDLNKGGS